MYCRSTYQREREREVAMYVRSTNTLLLPLTHTQRKKKTLSGAKCKTKTQQSCKLSGTKRQKHTTKGVRGKTIKHKTATSGGEGRRRLLTGHTCTVLGVVVFMLFECVIHPVSKPAKNSTQPKPNVAEPFDLKAIYNTCWKLFGVSTSIIEYRNRNVLFFRVSAH